ncbi:MAG: glycosyltransferase family 2 protein, partial [bacterium]|nr:glycosyltransferase family 2 protein [bacterium]
MTTPPLNLSIIIVSWNVREHLRANLARLFALHARQDNFELRHGAPSCMSEVPPSVRDVCSNVRQPEAGCVRSCTAGHASRTFEVFVVDNGSHDGTAAMVRGEFPKVHLITNAWDAGFAGPNNQALRLARGEVCLLLNPDMLVEDGALDATYDALTRDRTIGVLGGRLLHADGTPIIGSVRRFPDVWSQLAIVLKLGRLFPRLLNRYLWDDLDFTRSQDVDQVRGSFFAFRRELLKTIGFLDAGYHLWFEEVDYCRRVRAAGLRVRYCAEAIARDYIGKGFAQMGHLEKQRIFTASMLRYFRKWHQRWQWALLALARPLGLLAAA